MATEVAALATRREVAVAWLARHYAERKSRAIAAQGDEAKLQQSTTAALYGAGRVSQAEVLAARTTTVELANRATDAALAGERARLALARHVGAGEADRPLGAPPDVLVPPDAIGHLTDVARQPELRLAHAQEALLDTEADLARAGRLPDWSAELTYGIRKAEFGNMVSYRTGTQKNRFIFLFSYLKGFFRPRIPIDLLRCGMSEVRRFFYGESVHFGRSLFSLLTFFPS